MWQNYSEDTNKIYQVIRVSCDKGKKLDAIAVNILEGWSSIVYAIVSNYIQKTCVNTVGCSLLILVSSSSFHWSFQHNLGVRVKVAYSNITGWKEFNKAVYLQVRTLKRLKGV